MEFNGGVVSPPAFYGFPPPNPIHYVPELKKEEGPTRSEIVARAVGMTIAIFLLLAAAAAAAYCINRKMKKRERRTQPPLPIQWPVLSPPLVEPSAPPLPPVVEEPTEEPPERIIYPCPEEPTATGSFVVEEPLVEEPHSNVEEHSSSFQEPQSSSF